VTPKPKQLIPPPQAVPTIRDVRDSIQWLRSEAQNRGESHWAAIADEMEWLAREVLATERIDYGRAD
jgi:hypothetical protein